MTNTRTRNKTALLFGAISLGLWVVSYMTPYDDSDDRQNGKRSGMIVYTDHLTGCQYLKGGAFGGMTPRLDGAGRQVGCN
jgi:hypothetical protein